ncbi:MAG: nuclear transport factor 2 family protein [Pyrinomonadaceae bacterium]
MRTRLPLVIFTLLVCASVCFGQSDTGKTAKSKSAEMAKGSLEQTLIAEERALWEAWKNKDAKPYEQWLAEDSVYVHSTGVDGKASEIKGIADPTCEVKSYALDNFKVTMLDKDAALLTFHATQDFACGGKAGPTAVQASSIYVKRNGKWLNWFHQETPAAQ